MNVLSRAAIDKLSTKSRSDEVLVEEAHNSDVEEAILPTPYRHAHILSSR